MGALLDPDPLRYMWVDEGGGRLREFLDNGEQALARAVPLPGHRRLEAETVSGSGSAVRPSLAVAPDGRVLLAWLEWRAGEGEQVVALVREPSAPEGAVPQVLSPADGTSAADHFRPTVAFDDAGVGWLCYGRSDGGSVGVWCRRLTAAGWQPEELVSTTAHPSFNQEVVAHADGSMEVCWQGPHQDGFGIFTRRCRGGVWSDTELVSADVDGNVWDPAVVALPGGGSAYAWSEYLAGSYRVCLRRSDGHGAFGPVRPLTEGSDYALHPSLAVTTTGDLWVAFDVLSVHGHGGSGPTRLRPTERVGEPVWPVEMRHGGVAIPPELLPEIEAGIRVLRVEESGLFEPDGVLAPSLDLTPGGLPRLVADASGGLTVAYRIHRRLPLMTYYWEVACQSLGPDGWLPPATFTGSDATLEEPAVATADGLVLIAWQCDHRQQRGLTWTEGFGVGSAPTCSSTRARWSGTACTARAASGWAR